MMDLLNSDDYAPKTAKVNQANTHRNDGYLRVGLLAFSVTLVSLLSNVAFAAKKLISDPVVSAAIAAPCPEPIPVDETPIDSEGNPFPYPINWEEVDAQPDGEVVPNRAKRATLIKGKKENKKAVKPISIKKGGKTAVIGGLMLLLDRKSVV